MFFTNRWPRWIAAALATPLASLAIAQQSQQPFSSSPATYIPATPASTAKPGVIDTPDVPPQMPEVIPAVVVDKDEHAEAAAPPLPQERFPREMLDGFAPAARAAFNLREASVQELRMIEHAGETLVAIRMAANPLDAGVERIVHLHQHSMRDPNARLLVQGRNGLLVETPWPAVTTYRGTVAGEPGIEVAASILDGRVSMMLLPDDPAQPTWFMQPLSDGVPGMPAGLHVVYRNDDVMPTGAQCGWTGDPNPPVFGGAAPRQPALGARVMQAPPPAQPPADPTAKAEPPGEGGIAGQGGIAAANVRCQIGLDADVEFYQANGSSVLLTIYDMELIMNQVGLIYQNQVAISYTETILIVRTAEPDPYGATTAVTLLCQFQDFWNSDVIGPRDVAHLFTGKDLEGNTVGLAWIGSLCLNITNCNGGQGGYGLVQSRFATDLASRVQDSAHELGHNWNGCHCNTGGNCGGGTSNPVCGIMTSNISGQLTFDSAAVTAITAWRDSLTCLDTWFNPTYVNWAWNGIENGSSSNPWNTIFEGLDACLVGGTLNVQAGNYFQNPNIFKAKTINAIGGTVRIGN
jgi:hypothetical protein